jgi:hypothetical protein
VAPITWGFYYGIPLLAATVAWHVERHLSNYSKLAALTGIGIVGTLLFGLAVQASQHAAEWANSDPPMGGRSVAYARFMKAMVGCALWSSLAALASSSCLIASLAVRGPGSTIFLSLSIFFAFYFSLLLIKTMGFLAQLVSQRMDAITKGVRG